MKLILGVNNVAYAGEDTTTTGEVAKILESEYHIMQVFYELNKKKIQKQVANRLAGMVESIIQGVPENPGKIKMDDIEEDFRDFLSSDTWQRVTGQTIAAAAAGVNHRMKRPYVKANKSRPAFIDTGLYQKSFRAEIE